MLMLLMVVQADAVVEVRFLASCIAEDRHRTEIPCVDVARQPPNLHRYPDPL